MHFFCSTMSERKSADLYEKLKIISLHRNLRNNLFTCGHLSGLRLGVDALLFWYYFKTLSTCQTVACWSPNQRFSLFQSDVRHITFLFNQVIIFHKCFVNLLNFTFDRTCLIVTNLHFSVNKLTFDKIFMCVCVYLKYLYISVLLQSSNFHLLHGTRLFMHIFT